MSSIDAATPLQKSTNRADLTKVLLPYGLAILIQLPMLMLYFRQLWNRPHYQPFAVAILATVGLAIYRWPFDAKYPFHKSIVADVLLILGLGGALLGTVFVEPWFVAASVIFLSTSLLARTLDRESLTTLWPCSLPLFVYLMLPGGMDVRLITKLQQYSATHTSRLLDLAGLGHHMNGTVIKVPGMKEYGIEQACSGIQSFFTLLLVATIFVVASRRIRIPKNLGVIGFSIFAAIVFFFVRAYFLASPFSIDLSLIVVVGFALFAIIGFQSTALILSAVFWAVFMNTLRILMIPLADHFLEIDLSEGMSHDLLGYAVLALGILLVLSTDQFLMFLFGPVDPDNEDSGQFGGAITKFWNRIFAGASEEDERSAAEKRALLRKPITKTGQTFIWGVAGLVVVLGLYQFVEVQRSKAHPDLKVQFFSSDDLTVEFEREDLPEVVSDETDAAGGGPWKLIRDQKDDGYNMIDRTHGSDLGQRSDAWTYRSRTNAVVASFDQTFPGWHELTVCYQNQGWKMINRQKIVPEGDDEWAYIEADFERTTGEKGYLVFSHFDAFGEGLDAPREWGTINSFLIRAQNRMDHRIRAQLFQSEAYQTQVFTSSFNELPEENKAAIRSKYLKIREKFRTSFLEKRKAGQNGGAGSSTPTENVEAQ